MDAGARSSRNMPMEGLRGLAVLLVFFVHYHALFADGIPRESLTYAASGFMANIGHSGVDLFFVLSGYLIYGTVIRKHRPYLGFIARRIQRIHPTFLTVLAIYVALSVLFPENSKLPAGLSPAALLVVENALLLPGIFPVAAIVVVSWTLSYEFFFYLTIPVLVAALRLRRWGGGQRATLFVALALAYLGVCLPGYSHHMRLVMFVSGILVYEAIHSFGVKGSPPVGVERAVWVMLLLTFAGIYLSIDRPELISNRLGQFYRVVILFASFPLFTLACFNSTGSLHRVFTWSPLRWLGNMSYSYYLIHGLTLHGIKLLRDVLGSPANQSIVAFWLAMAACFACTLVVAAALFLAVEKPLSLAPAVAEARARATA